MSRKLVFPRDALHLVGARRAEPMAPMVGGVSAQEGEGIAEVGLEQTHGVSVSVEEIEVLAAKDDRCAAEGKAEGCGEGRPATRALREFSLVAALGPLTGSALLDKRAESVATIAKWVGNGHGGSPDGFSDWLAPVSVAETA